MSSSNDSKSLSKARYGRFAGRYVASPTHARGVDLERLLELSAPQADWRVLDVATGGGHTALKFAPHVHQVVATDLTEKMLAAAREFLLGQGLGQFRFSLADAEALPFVTGSFDLVTCRIAAHHFPDPARFVQEAARVARPAGLVVVQDQLMPDDPAAGQSVNDFERHRDPSHSRALSQGEWLALLTAAGLDVQAVEALLKRHKLVSWAERQGATPETIAALQARLKDMPPIARDWLQPQDWGTSEASFAIHHIIITARKLVR